MDKKSLHTPVKLKVFVILKYVSKINHIIYFSMWNSRILVLTMKIITFTITQVFTYLMHILIVLQISNIAHSGLADLSHCSKQKTLQIVPVAISCAQLSSCHLFLGSMWAIPKHWSFSSEAIPWLGFVLQIVMGLHNRILKVLPDT